MLRQKNPHREEINIAKRRVIQDDNVGSRDVKAGAIKVKEKEIMKAKHSYRDS